MELTAEEVDKIALGYNWGSEMSLEDFCAANKKLSRQESYEIYEYINTRYVNYKYEKR